MPVPVLAEADAAVSFAKCSLSSISAAECLPGRLGAPRDLSRVAANLPRPACALSLTALLPTEAQGTRDGLLLLSQTSRGPLAGSSSFMSSHFWHRRRSASALGVRRAVRSGDGAREGRGAGSKLPMGSPEKKSLFADPREPVSFCGVADGARSLHERGAGAFALVQTGALGSEVDEGAGPARVSEEVGRDFDSGAPVKRGKLSLSSAVTNRSSKL